MIRIVLFRVDGNGDWIEGVLHTFNDGKAVVETKSTGEMNLVPVAPANLKFQVVTDQWVKMQMDAQRQAQHSAVTAPNIGMIRR